MKRLSVVVALVFIVALTAPLSAQESMDTPLFLQNMMQMMLQRGWEEDDVQEFGDACLAYQWEGFADVDPQVLMFSMRYAWQIGDGEEGIAVQNRAALAHALAHQAQEMARVGLDDRDIAVMTAGATRDSLRVATRAELSNPESGELLRTRIQDATQDHVQQLDRERVRDGEQGGATVRYNETGTPGTPPGGPPAPGPDDWTPPSDPEGPQGPGGS